MAWVCPRGYNGTIKPRVFLFLILGRPLRPAGHKSTNYVRQRTIQNLVRTTGVGVHSGRRVELTLRPAQPNTGIVFHRVDLPQVVDLPAQATGVGDTRMASVLQQGNVRVSTVEHLMSALAGLGIDNLHVDLTAEEVPIMDGSAATFVYLLRSAGIVEQNAPKQFIRVLKPIEVREGEGRNENGPAWSRMKASRWPFPSISAIRPSIRPPISRRSISPPFVCARDRPRPYLRLRQ